MRGLGMHNGKARERKRRRRRRRCLSVCLPHRLVCKYQVYRTSSVSVGETGPPPRRQPTRIWKIFLSEREGYSVAYTYDNYTRCPLAEWNFATNELRGLPHGAVAVGRSIIILFLPLSLPFRLSALFFCCKNCRYAWNSTQ